MNPAPPGPGPTTRRSSGRSLLCLLVTALLSVGTVVGGGAAAQAAPGDPRPLAPLSTAPEKPSRYQGQVSCDPVEKPGVTVLRDLLKRTYGKANSGGSARACAHGGTSEHKEGRAYDWMLDVNKPADRAMADTFLAWLTGPDGTGVVGGNAHRMGIQYVIWNKRTWQSWTGSWKTYTGASPHTDHVHISLSWDGAFARTSWWTGTAVTAVDFGPCRQYVGELAPRYTAPNYHPCPKPVSRPVASYGSVVAADFDGDGRTDVATYSHGSWVLQTGSTVTRFHFGRTGDVPVAGDWDGDGKAGIGVFRGGDWFLREAAGPGAHDRAFRYGRAGDRPVAGAWAGRHSGIGIVRGNTWHLRPTATTGPADAPFGWGRSTDTPVTGDWDGSGRAGIGVYRAGTWYLAATARPGSSVRSLTFGHTSGLPVGGDWDGDRRATVGTLRGNDFLQTDSATGGSGRTVPVPY